MADGPVNAIGWEPAKFTWPAEEIPEGYELPLEALSLEDLEAIVEAVRGMPSVEERLVDERVGDQAASAEMEWIEMEQGKLEKLRAQVQGLRDRHAIRIESWTRECKAREWQLQVGERAPSPPITLKFMLSKVGTTSRQRWLLWQRTLGVERMPILEVCPAHEITLVRGRC